MPIPRRKAKELATFFVDETSADQAAWIRDLLSRVTHPGRNATAVTVLDSGVTRGHPLLEFALASEDVHTSDPNWADTTTVATVRATARRCQASRCTAT